MGERRMISTAAASHGTYAFATLSTIVALCGLAATQNVCFTEDGPNCPTALRFQWWGWALQVAFLVLTAWYAKTGRSAKGGLTAIGATSTLLAMIFANETLIRSEEYRGKLFSRTTLLFVGWLLVATANYLTFLCMDLVPATAGTTACCDKKGKGKAAATAGEVDVAATARTPTAGTPAAAIASV
ncbi:MFS transporter [Micractinium conductrix]|uniref:MFS transporter n=1 Tax=Micractinium conductrix TaxID=554055 RepID=A0A2P6VMC3_9CHLO|nr:MFS transporter [Micractinium conductrix]|eukprot:PSC75251.1 MFS transporter [Micractinium conductrix]